MQRCTVVVHNSTTTGTALKHLLGGPEASMWRPRLAVLAPWPPLPVKPICCTPCRIDASLLQSGGVKGVRCPDHHDLMLRFSVRRASAGSTKESSPRPLSLCRELGHGTDQPALPREIPVDGLEAAGEAEPAAARIAVHRHPEIVTNAGAALHGRRSGASMFGVWLTA